MEKNEIVGYELLVNDLKQLIQKKQYHVLQMINSETIICIGKSVKRFLDSNRKRAGESPLFKCYQLNCKKSFQGPRDIQQQICGECVTFICNIPIT